MIPRARNTSALIRRFIKNRTLTSKSTSSAKSMADKGDVAALKHATKVVESQQAASARSGASGASGASSGASTSRTGGSSAIPALIGVGVGVPAGFVLSVNSSDTIYKWADQSVPTTMKVLKAIRLVRKGTTSKSSGTSSAPPSSKDKKVAIANSAAAGVIDKSTVEEKTALTVEEKAQAINDQLKQALEETEQKLRQVRAEAFQALEKAQNGVEESLSTVKTQLDDLAAEYSLRKSHQDSHSQLQEAEAKIQDFLSLLNQAEKLHEEALSTFYSTERKEAEKMLDNERAEAEKAVNEALARIGSIKTDIYAGKGVVLQSIQRANERLLSFYNIIQEQQDYYKQVGKHTGDDSGSLAGVLDEELVFQTEQAKRHIDITIRSVRDELDFIQTETTARLKKIKSAKLATIPCPGSAEEHTTINQAMVLLTQVTNELSQQQDDLQSIVRTLIQSEKQLQVDFFGLLTRLRDQQQQTSEELWQTEFDNLRKSVKDTNQLLSDSVNDANQEIKALVASVLTEFDASVNEKVDKCVSETDDRVAAFEAKLREKEEEERRILNSYLTDLTTEYDTKLAAMIEDSYTKLGEFQMVLQQLTEESRQMATDASETLPEFQKVAQEMLDQFEKERKEVSSQLRFDVAEHVNELMSAQRSKMLEEFQSKYNQQEAAFLALQKQVAKDLRQMHAKLQQQVENERLADLDSSRQARAQRQRASEDTSFVRQRAEAVLQAETTQLQRTRVKDIAQFEKEAAIAKQQLEETESSRNTFKFLFATSALTALGLGAKIFMDNQNAGEIK